MRKRYCRFGRCLHFGLLDPGVDHGHAVIERQRLAHPGHWLRALGLVKDKVIKKRSHKNEKRGQVFHHQKFLSQLNNPAKDGLNNSPPVGVASHRLLDYGISPETAEIQSFFHFLLVFLALCRAVALFSGALMRQHSLICCAPSKDWTAQTA